MLLSDLFEGGDKAGKVKKAQAMVDSGVTMIALLALSDNGAPGYDHELAAKLQAMGIPSFACTPDLFPELMAAAIKGDDLQAFASRVRADG